MARMHQTDALRRSEPSHVSVPVSFPSHPGYWYAVCLKAEVCCWRWSKLCSTKLSLLCLRLCFNLFSGEFRSYCNIPANLALGWLVETSDMLI